MACGGQSDLVGGGGTGGSAPTAGTGQTAGVGGGAAGAVGKGGSAGAPATGGAGGTGGSIDETGGVGTGDGGATDGAGGVAGGGGGSTGGVGGVTAGSGGSTSGAGGVSAGSGGADAGTAGVTGGSSGSGTGAGGTSGSGSGTGGGGGGSGAGSADDINSGPNTMGWVGCSMASNVAEGYARIGGTRMWGSYGGGGAVVQDWTNVNSGSWNGFDNQVEARGGTLSAVWIMVCAFSSGLTMDQIRQIVANTKIHAPGAYLYITGQPLYEEGHVCTLAGEGVPENTDLQAQMIAAEDPDVHYAGALGPLNAGEYSGDSCHTTSTGGDKLGRQVKAIWGQP
jgi:hypothetical protein